VRVDVGRPPRDAAEYDQVQLGTIGGWGEYMYRRLCPQIRSTAFDSVSIWMVTVPTKMEIA
jgi:hypothetical protein